MKGAPSKGASLAQQVNRDVLDTSPSGSAVLPLPSSARGPPTPSSTRMAFLPSALKKKQQQPTQAGSSSSSGEASEGAAASRASAASASASGSGKNVRTGAVTGSSSSNAMTSSSSSTPIGRASASSSAQHQHSQHPTTTSGSSRTLANAQYPADSQQHLTSSRTRDQAEAAEERAKERLYGASLVSSQEQASENTGYPQTSTTRRQQQAQQATSVGSAAGSTGSTAKRPPRGTAVHQSSYGFGRAVPSLNTQQTQQQPAMHLKSTTTSPTTATTTTSYGFASPAMTPSLGTGGGENDRQLAAGASGAAAGASSSGSTGRNAGMQMRDADAIRRYYSRHDEDDEVPRSSTPGLAHHAPQHSPDEDPSTREAREKAENELAAKLGGGIGLTSDRIGKHSTSRKDAISSPNNLDTLDTDEDDHPHHPRQATATMHNGRKSGSSGSRASRGDKARKGSNAGSGSEKQAKKRTSMHAIDFEKQGHNPSEKQSPQQQNQSANDNHNNNDKKKQQGIQFSPKVTTAGWNISWRAIKRKLMLASTGTPSSGEGSRRSETSETSGGSRHRQYLRSNANAAAAAHGHHGHGGHNEKTVHIQGIEDGLEDEDWEVDQVVVDNEWYDDEGNALLWDGSRSVSAAPGTGAGGAHGAASGQHGAHGGGGAHGTHHSHHERSSNGGRDNTTGHSETAGSLIINPTIKVIDGVVTFFKGYLIPKLNYFFEPRFGDPDKEENFRKERWYNTKRNATFGCAFLCLNWLLLVALLNPIGIWQKVMYYGVLTLFTWILPVLVAFDMPRKSPNTYSLIAITAVMMPAFFGVISMYICHFLSLGADSCQGQTFLTIQYYATAFCVIALFALGVNRLMTALSQTIYWILNCVMLIPDNKNYSRTAINFLIFSIFILFLHFQQERIDRRMFTLRAQLKISYRALQKSQIAEKKAANSKKRFISYIFHEVRVPLNTAYLAFQNLQHTGGFNRDDEDQMVEVYALESSLQQVQQVLNDVLDLQRMDAGRFESSSQPFNFHRAIQALVASLKVAATAKRLNLDVSLDERIDNLPQSLDIFGQRASYVMGDEIRLRQVLTNIASNAVKFSREGKGGIKVRTKLIWPTEQALADHDKLLDMGDGNDRIAGDVTRWRDSDVTPNVRPASREGPFPTATDSDITFAADRDSRDRERDIEKEAGLPKRDASGGEDTLEMPKILARNDSDDSDASNPYKRSQRDFVILRIEIEDNGPGIKPSDMIDQRLFSAYVQTEIGRIQGGKGSGLGLAIVRAIVQMTRGRLGVQSSRHGTTFWIEQRYALATQSEVQELQELPTPLSFSPEEPVPKPLRPPVKPYRDGESSYSQYSQSKVDAAAALGLQPTPMSEHDRPLLGTALSRLPSTTPGLSETHRQASGSISSLPSAYTNVSAGNASNVGNTSATNAIDIHSPLTSENWSQSNLERSVMPSMNVTAATPPARQPSIAASTSSPPRSPHSRTASIPAASPVSMSDAIPMLPASTLQSTSETQVTPSGGDDTPRRAVDDSPAGEEAFTPMTRQIVTVPTPEAEVPSRMSPLPPALSSAKRSSASSVPSVTSALSASASTSPPPQAGSAQAQIPAQEKLNALIVDDDPLTRKLMSRMMSRLGCNVDEAENGQMFLDVALGDKAQGKEAKHYDIVTLDNAMPIMTGEEAIRVFRKAGRKDLVVGATGNALKSDQNAYLKAGVDTVLTKPISARDLTAQLNVARRRRQLAENQASQGLAPPS